jgi:hypothetical protein
MKKLLVIAAMFVGVSAFAQEVYIPNAFTPDGDAVMIIGNLYLMIH